MDVSGALVLARWVYFLSVMTLFGSALFCFYATDSRKETLSRGMNLGLALAAVIAATTWLLYFTADLAGDEGMLPVLRGILLESGFGVVWIVRLSLAIVLVAVSFSGKPAWIAGPAFLLLVSEGWHGHAAALGLLGSFTQAIHVASVGAWIGGLVPLGRVIMAARRHPADTPGAASALWRFSRFGMVAVALIAATGALNAWLMLQSFPDPGSNYGKVLLIKIGLFSGMVGLAAYNRHTLAIRMSTAPAKGLRTLSRTVMLEQIIGIAVLLNVSALGLMDPNA